MDEPQTARRTPTRASNRRHTSGRCSQSRTRALDRHEHDLLDEPVLPSFGLSAATLAAVFVGGALGHRRPLPPRSAPPARARAASPGSPCWST